MTYDTSFMRLVAIGTLYGTEQFSWSLALRYKSGDETVSRFSEVPAAVIAAVEDFHTAGGVAYVQAILKTIKFNLIGHDGRYIGDTTVLHDFETPGVAGTNTSNMYPPQVALAVSLGTAKSRGRASRGRFYLPLPSVPLTTSGTINTANLSGIVTAATTFLNALNTALPDYEVAVMSNIGTGTSERVTHVRVGHVLDTIRSRRSSLDEAYLEGATLTA